MKSRHFRIAAGASLLLFAAGVLAGNYSFLKDSPIGHFNDDDVALMMKASSEVLESEDLSASSEWRNAATNNSGSMNVLRAFLADDGRYCKVLQVINRAGSLESRARYPVCKVDDGRWIIDVEAKPAKPVEETDAANQH